MSGDLSPLYKRLSYSFENPVLLETALTHSSHGKLNNERLEFLGDSILGWVIAEALYQSFPEGHEGQLSRLRAGLVKGETLAEMAREFDLGAFLRLGPGELKSGGHRRDSILADALEAVIGAIYLDGGVDKCRKVLLGWYQPRLSSLSLADTMKDAKTRLQEYMQSRKQALPEYSIVKTFGQDHQQTFEVACQVVLLSEPCIAQGRSRRQAEQSAAHAVLQALNLE